jgi:small subunit ribosomal protein S16
MVKIRLRRVGKKKQPSYRVIVADSRSPRDGRIIEAIGHYNPRVEPSEVVIDTERAEYWIQRGAQPSNSVRKLLEIATTGAPPPESKAARRVTVAGAGGVPIEEPAETPEAVDSGPSAQESAAPATETEGET